MNDEQAERLIAAVEALVRAQRDVTAFIRAMAEAANRDHRETVALWAQRDEDERQRFEAIMEQRRREVALNLLPGAIRTAVGGEAATEADPVRRCRLCRSPLPEGSNRDRQYCSRACIQAAWLRRRRGTPEGRPFSPTARRGAKLTGERAAQASVAVAKARAALAAKRAGRA